ncbi:Uncharacterized protein TCM_036988 [Theobroma cacao]|uniref:Uncharacterized protein n=1 Tax=Theobroma cacao TaxID=3641 RepID=A0A061GJX1_THECC|nr:Uncharacterized protein TCM_036988 [Theobroma cacao]
MFSVRQQAQAPSDTSAEIAASHQISYIRPNGPDLSTSPDPNPLFKSTFLSFISGSFFPPPPPPPLSPSSSPLFFLHRERKNLEKKEETVAVLLLNWLEKRSTNPVPL